VSEGGQLGRGGRILVCLVGVALLALLAIRVWYTFFLN